MDIFKSLLSLSECIETLTNKIRKEEDDFIYDLLNDMYLEEERILDSLNETKWNSLVKYLHDYYHLDLSCTVFELYYKNSYSLSFLRVYELIKERNDQKHITSLKRSEMNKLSNNILVKNIKESVLSIKKIDIAILRFLKEKKDFYYIFSSFVTPYCSLLNHQISGSLISLYYSLDVLKPYFISIVTNLLTENDNQLKQKYCRVLEGYFTVINPIYHEELICFIESKIVEISKEKKIPKSYFEDFQDFMDSMGYEIGNIEDLDQEIEFPIQKCELLSFTYHDIVTFDEAMQKLYFLASIELALFLKIRDSKINHERSDFRSTLYIELTRLEKERNEICEKLDINLFKSYLYHISPFYEVPIKYSDYHYSAENYFAKDISIPYDILDCAREILTENLPRKEIVNNLIYEKVILNVEDYELKTIVPNKEELQLINCNMTTEETYFLSILKNNLEVCFTAFLNQRKEENYDFIVDTAYYLMLYLDPQYLRYFITQDFEISYFYKQMLTIPSKYKEMIFEVVRKVFEEFKKRGDEDSQTMFVMYLNFYRKFLLPEDFKYLQEVYYQKIKNYKNELKRKK